jgi:hypothetical protein
MSVVSALLPLERTRWYRDKDGNLSTSKRFDEIVGLSLDFTDHLASAETVSSVSTVPHGVTISGASLATPVWTANVTGVGYLEWTATLSTGRVLQSLVCFYGTDEALLSDYR